MHISIKFPQTGSRKNDGAQTVTKSWDGILVVTQSNGDWNQLFYVGPRSFIFAKPLDEVSGNHLTWLVRLACGVAWLALVKRTQVWVYSPKQVSYRSNLCRGCDPIRTWSPAKNKKNKKRQIFEYLAFFLKKKITFLNYFYFYLFYLCALFRRLRFWFAGNDSTCALWSSSNQTSVI